METGLPESLEVEVELHGSYLQGMETFDAIHNWHRFYSTDPTYKEWKPGLSTCGSLQSRWHGSYLQGMETRHHMSKIGTQAEARILPTRNGNQRSLPARCRETEQHGSYLQGMETRVGQGRHESLYISTDPTYKEWKLAHPVAARPRREGCTDPTYKEWEPLFP